MEARSITNHIRYVTFEQPQNGLWREIPSRLTRLSWYQRKCFATFGDITGAWLTTRLARLLLLLLFFLALFWVDLISCPLSCEFTEFILSASLPLPRMQVGTEKRGCLFSFVTRTETVWVRWYINKGEQSASCVSRAPLIANRARWWCCHTRLGYCIINQPTHNATQRSLCCMLSLFCAIWKFSCRRSSSLRFYRSVIEAR